MLAINKKAPGIWRKIPWASGSKLTGFLITKKSATAD
jgi:hypothetical protein